MRNLVIMPNVATNRERMNLGEFAEEATIIVDEPVRPANHFIEANTQEVTLHHLKHDCITPVFAKDNELTINHAAFVETISLKAESLKPSTNLPTNFWNLTRLSTMKGRLSALTFQPFMKLLEETG